MNKQKAKAILNWLLFAACIAGAAYMGFAATGLTVTERIALAGTSLGGLFVAMGGLLPRLNKAIDDLPGGEPRDPQKGGTNLLVAIVLAVVAVFLGLAYAVPAKADTPISKCWAKVCAEPQVSVSVVEYNLATRKIGAGVLPVGSVGYGIRDVNDYVAAGVYLSASIGSGQPNYLSHALLVRFMGAFTVGAQLRLGEDVNQVSLLAGGGFGL